MLTLYVKAGCPYCAKVLEKVEELELEVEKKDILDKGVLDELLELGDKRQVPFLIDPERDSKMYGSDDINRYLDTYYGENKNDEDNEEVISGNSDSCTSEC